eukprot:scaffold96_cov302-Prasinococcus_capsulatus_cf.AAC.9
MIKLLVEYGVDLDARNPNDWTALQYAKASGPPTWAAPTAQLRARVRRCVALVPPHHPGKYGAVYEKGIYPEDVLLYYGATVYGSGPEAHGNKSPRNRYPAPPSRSTVRMREGGLTCADTGRDAATTPRRTTSCAIVLLTRTPPPTLRHPRGVTRAGGSLRAAKRFPAGGAF